MYSMGWMDALHRLSVLQWPLHVPRHPHHYYCVQLSHVTTYLLLLCEDGLQHHPRAPPPRSRGAATRCTDLGPYQANLPSSSRAFDAGISFLVVPIGGNGWIRGMPVVTNESRRSLPAQPVGHPSPMAHRPIVPADIGSLLVDSCPLRMKERALHRQPVSATILGHHLASCPANEETRGAPRCDTGCTRTGPVSFSRPPKPAQPEKSELGSDQRPPSTRAAMTVRRHHWPRVSS